MTINKELLDILACPVCKESVELKEEKLGCVKCGRRYPIKDGIPVMLVDEAEVS
ncbi:MAG: Trm112 family protein [PVC group bacterium]|nr:Trm112 family protein [PVC group bacterium]